MAPAIWHPPTLRKDSNEEVERRSTWLELFLDLVFVATIGQISHTLSGEISWFKVAGFILFFIPTWWCWVGSTFYATRFDTDGLFDRLFAFIQIVIVAAMAVHVHHGLGEGDIGFALCYSAFRIQIVFQYQLAGYYNPIAKALVNRYSLGFSLSMLLWLASLLVPAPWRYGLWILGLMIDLGTPLSAGNLLVQIPPSFTHIPERIGLFTIIVLGEAVLGVIRGLGSLEWTFAAEITAVLGLMIAFCLWWLYFDSVDGSPLKTLKAGKRRLGLFWLYAHLPLTAGLAMAGVGLDHLINNGPETPPDSSEQWLFCGALALVLTALATIHWMTCSLGTPEFRRVLSAYRMGSALFILLLALAGPNLTSLEVVAWTAVACLVQVGLDIIFKSSSTQGQPQS
ncbi:MAG: low temperature requirement protein A [Leptolyngbya sp.]|nr:low temperature requirement protein A [Leptolyngbya sp.]